MYNIKLTFTNVYGNKRNIPCTFSESSGDQEGSSSVSASLVVDVSANRPRVSLNSLKITAMRQCYSKMENQINIRWCMLFFGGGNWVGRD
ncbi:hypothetical protein CEXT_760391 [Caerostris extrusa]|uniref:Uncharacterized protein n=1 Tax=Caerostris extrusa TaxID=172846 RepID=A0AAV4TCL8_CAEEX|nr:hypothetical protein CEXT_760391 [Caerostris extrusa]